MTSPTPGAPGAPISPDYVPVPRFALGRIQVRRSAQLRHAAAGIDIVCVQNLFHLADRRDSPILQECLSRGIAFVPFCPLGWPRGRDNPVFTSPVVNRTATRLGITPAQVALKWLLQLAPNVLLIPGTGSVAHLRENLAAEDVTLDHEALRELDGVGG